ncbi:MAG: KUP/HAK/KT family potassium transporter [Atopobiaceae bacterium]|nr:KUP/HAK/KT family potassium transporter [Atopobiaceae bacterium]MCH4215141.1 KUP/HAK/KT family potassium transporter [Atopobiaceae bacterium]MCI1226380.1 KUP/HAK/KT family potassium transporter [Atopobiaceae bacterium]MDD3176924.1 KUP/HAK/KT family potassium transporter [Atopobiaceae bacterium]MDD4380981.1 KUP/HAK/KT family potassium transporter [Atopobiaceae bacterium]
MAGATKGADRRNGAIPFSVGMVLVTLGVVYGDIGTSPMYVMKAIVNGNGGLSSVSEDVILGALSLIIWTLTLITTVKYVVIAMKADNHNEGGIFALYSLVRKCGKWLIIPAMVGGAALLADGILTPAVTVTTAIEGLRTTDFGAAFLGETPTKVIIITIAILAVLFLVQRAGTSSIGRAFGPIMMLWFLFLGATGIWGMSGNLGVLRALNPVRGVMFLFSPTNHAGLMVLGYVFLATTGAEALYSDMGHVGKSNIYASWPFVKVCLILNYLGQGAWLIANANNATLDAIPDMNPFFQMLPEQMRTFAVILSTVAAIIASQALITGSYTLVSEATRLDLMPHLQIHYPSETKGQLYIPLVNTIMWVGCTGVVLLFQTSSHMEAAYGLAITLTMLMTTLLLTVYLGRVRHNPAGAVVFCCFFVVLEAAFFFSSLTKFAHGGYVTILMAAVLFALMVIWRRGTAVEHTQTVYLPVERYVDQLRHLRDDASYPLLADNLVFLTNDSSLEMLDRDILYSILDKHPKRAKAYWFLNVTVTDEPYTHSYVVNSFGTDFIFKVQLQLGFKVNQRVNAYLRQVVADLMTTSELAPQHHEYSIYKHPGSVGDFRFCMIRKVLAPETDITHQDRAVMTAKYFIRRVCGSAAQWYGLQSSAIIFEYVPLFGRERSVDRLERLPLAGVIMAHDSEADEEDIFTDSMAAARAANAEETYEQVIGGEETGSFPAMPTDDDYSDGNDSNDA